MRIPPWLQSGDSAVWEDDAQTLCRVSYDNTGYSLTYSLRGPSALDLTATSSSTGSGWQTAITPTQSAALLPGKYRWAAYYTATGVRVTAAEGEIEIGINLQTLAAGTTILSFYEQALAACEQAMAAYTSTGGQPVEWAIGANRYRFNSLTEIQAAAAYFNACATAEETRDMIKNGQGNPRKLFVRFS